jgi:hypothetical protein
LDDGSSVPELLAFRVRRGRGGVLLIDRRTARWPPPRGELLSFPRRSTSSATVDSEMPNDESTDEIEAPRCIRDRWLFDADDEPSLDPTALVRTIGFLWINSIPSMCPLIIRIIHR